MAKKGYNPDGSIDKSQTFTNGNTGVTTYADGSPAPNASQRLANQQQATFEQDKKQFQDAWAQYGGHPGYGKYGSTPGYVDKGDGSDAWKYQSYLSSYGMKNPVYINGPYGAGGFFDRPLPKKTITPTAPNVSGGQAAVPSVQQRMMSRMGQAVQKGVNKGSIKSNQLGKYQAPGTNNQGLDVNKVYNAFAQNQQTQDNARGVFNQAASSGAIKQNAKLS